MAVFLILGSGGPSWAELPDLRWRRTIPWPVHTLASTAGIVLAASDHGTFIYAFGLEDGKPLWERNLKGGIWSPPALFENHVLLIPFGAAAVSLRLETGDSNWQKGPTFPESPPLPSPPRGVPPGGSSRPELYDRWRAPSLCKASPVIHRRHVYSVSLDGLVSKLTLQGELVDQLELGPLRNREQFWASPAPLGESLFLGSTAGNLWQVDTQELRRIGLETLTPPHGLSFPSAMEVRADLLAHAGSLFVGTLDGSLFCQTGAGLSWSRRLGTGAPQLTSLGRVLGGPTVPASPPDSTRVYVSTLRALYCLEARTGETVWELPAPLGSAPAFWEDLVVVSTRDGRLLLARQAQGSLVGVLRLPSAPTCGPVVSGDAVVLGFADGVVEAYSLRAKKR